MNFNNEIIDGQSTVAENLAKTNRNFMLLKEILRSGASTQDIQNMLNDISQTYIKTTDIVNNLTSTETNKPVSALQAKNLKQDISNLTNQLQQLNQNVSNLTQQLNNKVDNNSKPLVELANINSTNQDLLNHAKNLRKSGYFNAFYSNRNIPNGNWDWAKCIIIFYDNTNALLEITSIVAPIKKAVNLLINDNWIGWRVI